MHLTEVIVNGFKSFGQRTVISGFDAGVNMITGLNGSGKSVLLESIGFVFGVSAESLGARNLSDVIHRDGQQVLRQAGVVLVFDNRARSHSPAGYEQFDMISVERRVTLRDDGSTRDRWMIQGRAVQRKAVQQLFNAPSSHLGNPKYCISGQGMLRLARADPAEILSKIEEAAGSEHRALERQRALQNQANQPPEEFAATIAKLDQERHEALDSAVQTVNGHLKEIVSTLLPGASTNVNLPDESRIDEGVVVTVRLPGTMEPRALSDLTHSQRVLVTFSLLLSLVKLKAAPICVLDRVDWLLGPPDGGGASMQTAQLLGRVIRAHLPQTQIFVVTCDGSHLNMRKHVQLDVLFQMHTSSEDRQPHITRLSADECRAELDKLQDSAIGRRCSRSAMMSCSTCCCSAPRARLRSSRASMTA